MRSRAFLSWTVAVASLVAVSAPVLADNDPNRPDEACHFDGEPNRWAKVDDAGLFGSSGNFAFDPPMDRPIEQWDMCPGCSLGITAADFEIDLDELTLMGVDVSQLDSLPGIVQALQNVSGLTDAQINQLANDLQPSLGQSIADIETELKRIRGKAQDQLTDLSDLDNLVNNIATLGDQDIANLLNGLGFEHDVAYTHDFDNPNDRPVQNTDIKVWGVPEVVQELTLRNVPAQTRMDIETALSNVPSLPGLIEISGDDDDPLSPAEMHGINTDLNVNYRSVSVTGNDVILHHFTIVNRTTKVYPYFSAAFFADIDVPPGSTDLDLSYDPLTQTLMGYDKLPQYDPEEHLYVGVGAALPLGNTAGLIPGAFHIDKKVTLANGGIVDAKRMRFMLLDPTLIGDLDDTPEGKKSEKFGAIAFQLPGPLMPGAYYSFGICQASSRGTSSGTALADTIAKIDACKAVMPLITPTCADGTFQFGEGCDDGNTVDGDGCSSTCALELCGDGKVTGGETCDDGNEVSFDGCSDICRLEVCGDGIVQPGEACDDGNTSNFDECLDDCTVGVCGDGWVKAGGYPRCGGRTHCINGTLTITGGATTDQAAFTGEVVPFGIGFDVVSSGAFPEEPRWMATNVVANFEAADPQLQIELDRWATPLNLGGAGNVALTVGGDDLVYIQATFNGRAAGFVEEVRFADAVTNGEIAFDESDFAYAVYEPPHTVTTTVEFIYPGAVDGFDADVVAALVSPGAGAITNPEACDDGNLNDGDACTSQCLNARCGDGFLHPFLGEQCDLGEANGVASGCTSACQLDAAALCGNGAPDPGEGCDDGGNVSGDGCNEFCQPEFCGDAVLQAGEDCDDGGTLAGDGCAPDCTLEFCGDGVVSVALGEECDEGAANSDTNPCTSTCLANVCGDGLILVDVETCDDGNTLSGDGCSDACDLEVCGDNVVGVGEECDDGNIVANDGCGPTCLVEFCGDGNQGDGEECDDGNGLDGDGCSKLCTLENPDACGDFIVGPGEECDDGNLDPGDGCGETCRLENPDLCGNGTLEPGEQCDDGNLELGDGCTPRCAIESCGDGTLQPGEQCDDGNRQPDDGCTACRVDETECGNGIHEYGEQCDGGDGCTPDCLLETPLDGPTLYATCGNGELDRGEQCDDGNQLDADGCGETCQLEDSICGNGRQERGEQCDPGDAFAGIATGCTPDCQLEAVCGDGEVGFGEQCDDGNEADGDGCSAICKTESCGDGIVQADEACDEGGANGRPGVPCSAMCVVTDGTVDPPIPNSSGGGCCTTVRAAPERDSGEGVAWFALVGVLGWLVRRRRTSAAQK